MNVCDAYTGLPPTLQWGASQLTQWTCQLTLGTFQLTQECLTIYTGVPLNLHLDSSQNFGM